ncbi:receptor-like protein 9DC3 [Impatiens glandulifera]|uniref:receptor-like protein 9DC3 n=1 Tax=Impatiens glandulifera TaxID=253017 RepID=UPI001FB0DEB8|nr:receptor-like protein 9DC3 [Impatiens glandulifera]
MTMKGFDAPIKGIILQFRTIIDLSSNKFEGAIPDVVGKLVGLTMLNISNNRLSGHIPVKLGNLVQLEQLDLSSNVALCGPPLSRKCQGRDSEDDDSDYAFMNGFTWQAVLMGYASGMIIGLGGGCLSFYTGRPKWFATMIDEEGYRIIKKYRQGRRLSSNLRLH